jgi:hypothetical protein
MQRATFVLAMHAAQMIVKDDLKRQGRRLCDVEYREIVALARDYLAKHPAKPMAYATEMVERWAKEGRWGPRGGFRSR